MDVTKRTVLVTGANGYVASWLVKLLLDNGHTVHAAVRDPGDISKVGHLLTLAEGSDGKLLLFGASLLDSGSYGEAMKGCSIVFHTASPFVLNVSDPQHDLVDPALIGTRNVLESVNNTPSVERVVLTSSIAAVFGDAADLLTYPNGFADEKMWNFSSSLLHQPYSFSKMVAEREAWVIADGQERWRLVVVNPALVVGPSLSKSVTSESFKIVRQLVDGTFAMGVPDFRFSFVDVRDVAMAHYKAAFLTEASGRFIVAARSSSLLQLSTMLRQRFGDGFRFARRTLPKWIVWLAGPMVGVPRRMISRNVGYDVKLDNSRSISVLGMEYSDIDNSVTEMFEQIIDGN
jgi:dihydroflavonol-4-reductase